MQERAGLISELQAVRWLVVVGLAARCPGLAGRMDVPWLPLRSSVPAVILAS